jgi:hypothetical protein
VFPPNNIRLKRPHQSEINRWMLLAVGDFWEGRDPMGETVYPRETPRFHPPDLRISYWGFSAMPVPIPGLKVDSDNQKVKFLMVFGLPKTTFFH